MECRSWLLYTYILNPNSKDGASKAKWFKEALGFSRANANELASQIKFDPSKEVKTSMAEFGTKYEQFITFKGANGKVIDVKFVWLVHDEDGVPRLVTAIPTTKK